MIVIWDCDLICDLPITDVLCIMSLFIGYCYAVFACSCDLQ